MNKETTTDKDAIEFFDIKIVNGDGIYESTFDVTIKRNGEILKKYNDIISGNYTNSKDDKWQNGREDILLFNLPYNSACFIDNT